MSSCDTSTDWFQEDNSKVYLSCDNLFQNRCKTMMLKLIVDRICNSEVAVSILGRGDLLSVTNDLGHWICWSFVFHRWFRNHVGLVVGHFRRSFKIVVYQFSIQWIMFIAYSSVEICKVDKGWIPELSSTYYGQ